MRLASSQRRLHMSDQYLKTSPVPFNQDDPAPATGQVKGLPPLVSQDGRKWPVMTALHKVTFERSDLTKWDQGRPVSVVRNVPRRATLTVEAVAAEHLPRPDLPSGIADHLEIELKRIIMSQVYGAIYDTLHKLVDEQREAFYLTLLPILTREQIDSPKMQAVFNGGRLRDLAAAIARDMHPTPENEVNDER